MSRHVLSVLVSNHSGVLSRVAGLFSRRGFNIDSLSVGETEHPEISRMTLVAHGDDLIIDQITKQLDKLHDVLYIKELNSEFSVYKELALVKVKAESKTRIEIIGIIDMFEGEIIDAATEAITVEITGDTSEINTFINLLEPYGIKELTRTGLIALQKGNHEIKDDINK
ncbi:acetolactate synthase small subunit [Petrocella sp. FN5]|uniref:acetolactate synthase small subunit n=1 Tax=Petrocella sp. FN5 TaxID=3032002 RepID=UPI0023DB80C8|nr:acetolactate synthase small subunit [Petrocella sp. FN5]MDF1617820.1 acetolactate synthase small subunit [Petrocella sp. FN5]